MPITRKFRYETDQESGFTGLTPLWIQNANPTSAIAHDILEHRNVEIGSAVTAELQAIGALLAIRLEQGVFPAANFNNSELLANPIFEVLQDATRDDIPLTPAPKTRALGDDYAWAEQLIQAAIPQAFEMSARESNDDEYDLERLGVLKTQVEHIVSWLRIGYRHALQRYAEVDLYTLGNSVFKAINQASQRLVDSEYLQEGTEVTVTVDVRNRNVNFRAFGQLIEV